MDQTKIDFHYFNQGRTDYSLGYDNSDQFEEDSDELREYLEGRASAEEDWQESFYNNVHSW